jgi:hypothetical protein
MATLLLPACSNGGSPPIVTSTATPTTVANKAVSAPISPKKFTDRTIATPTTQKSKIFLDRPTAKTSQSSPARISAVLGQAAPPPYGLIATTDKSRRQQELLARVNLQTNSNRDPFSTLPGSVAIPAAPPPLKLPPRPLVVPQPLVVASPRPYIPPQPKEAETVKVTGAVEIAGQRYAIVSVPGDVTSQYVRVGQRIAGDKVLVKYIETYGTPRVVLQQNGVEFTRYIK